MRLETEFRFCLQRQSLEWAFQQASTAPAHIDIAAPTLADLKQAIAPSMWVKLVQSPSAYSSDEALLLCQGGDRQWLVWVPDYGEIMLEREQFDPFS
ncbi:hypothetical protein [Stenomitos frigidus]|uniref:Uncharacterized protein n=1 Tax=Stenomitos frigidus ULC18 TaxID=2107698 RepID=A0A2T1EGI6_9CYAN|nr:hypothetical protein [Stenomitos frigidus]PSB31856.1 hypothetical protein C7B82_06455 [Stenomitos frigidus ULC18]